MSIDDTTTETIPTTICQDIATELTHTQKQAVKLKYETTLMQMQLYRKGSYMMPFALYKGGQ